MPLVRFEVKNEYGLGDPELYRVPAKREDPKALLDGIAVAGLVGILRQLGDLAEFAADIFHDLHEQVMATSARGHKVLNRIQHIEEALPSLEKTLQGQTSHIHFAYVAGSDWHAKLRTEQNHLLSSDLPRFMLDSYEECRDPPRLYLLDKFDTDGTGSCLKRYSDPSYFKRAWSASESDKAEKLPREKKPQRNKRRGSRIRNLEVQHVVPISRRNSSSMRFASLDGLDISTEQISMSDMRLNSEYECGTASSGSKARLSFVDQSLDPDPSLAADEAEIDKLSVSKIQTNHNDSCSSSNVDRNGNTADDDSQHDSLQGSTPRSPSVTWDEKAEILKPTSPRSCDPVPIDRDRDSEALPETSEPSNNNLEIAEFGDSEQNDILLDISNRRLSMSGGNHFDEVTSETDNYMDALNTLESETETDSECQTKREVKSLSNSGYQGMEPGIENMHGMAAINSDSSDIETPVASHNPSSKDAPPESSESSERIQSPFKTDIVSNGPNLDISTGNDGSEDVSDVLRMNGSEGIKDDSSAVSRAPDMQTQFFVENTSNTSKSIDFLSEASSVSSTKLWTNGGLLGLEPSKPPDFSVLNSTEGASGSKNTGCNSSSYTMTTKSQYSQPSGKSEARNTHNESMSRNFISLENIDGSPNTLSSVDQSSLNSDQLFGIIYNVAGPNSLSKCSPSYHQQDDVSVKKNSRESVEDLPLCQFENTRDSPDNLYAHIARHDQKIPYIAPGAEVPDNNSTESQPNESDPSTIGISSSFSGLAQRFLANSLQRRVSLTPVDIFNPSGLVNTDVRSQETSIQNKHKEGPTEVVPQISYLQGIRENIEQGSFKNSLSSSSRYSESSSPPLEHMKISFHPMNSSDTSKLKLEFPDANLHESSEDLTFPLFQLVPGPVLPLPDTGSESDDDTFCRSSAYSSEDIHTPHSYSNSELWEQDEMSGSRDHENYDDSHRISSSIASSSSLMELEQINHRRIDSATVFENYEAKDDTMSLYSGPIMDLPGLDSVVSLKNQEEGHCNSVSDDHVNSALQLPNELPPPPPLPPMQWRLMKASFTSGEDKGSSTPATVEHVDELPQRFLVAQQLEQTLKRPPCITESITAHSNKKTVHDLQMLNGNREQNHIVNGNNVDERGDLLLQIRNKAFNLRRIMPAKPTVTPQPATNVNVVAILEKANAIRQACAGSDEGGDDDNWSDN